MVERSIDCPRGCLAAIYLSVVHSIDAASIRTFRIRSTIADSAPVPCQQMFDSIDRSGITVKLSPYPASEHPPSLSPSLSLSLPLSTGGKGGLRRRKRKSLRTKLPQANGVGRGSRRIGI